MTPFHPFLVHFALSLAFLVGLGELFPNLRARVPEKGWRLVDHAAILFLLLAALAGWSSLHTLASARSKIPPLVPLHRFLAIAGTAAYAFLWLSAGRRVFALPSGSRRMIGLAGLVLILSAAALGGHLVYEDRLGTDVRSTAPSVSTTLP